MGSLPEASSGSGSAEGSLGADCQAAFHEDTLQPRVTAAVAELLPQSDLATESLYDFRCKISRHLGLGKKGLEKHAEAVNGWIREAVVQRSEAEVVTPEARMAKLVQELGEEMPQYKHLVHLVTISRVLPGTLEATDLRDVATMTRTEVADCVRLAFDNPLQDASVRGRKRRQEGGIVKKLVVVEEAHADNSKHFHVALLLTKSLTFPVAKRTLRVRDKVAAHFSSTHTQFWSAVRYCYIATVAKPNVDEHPLSWCHVQGWNALDLFAEAQRPWTADMWKRRREEAARTCEAGPHKKTKFNKLDLTAIILSQGLTSQAALLEYTQDHGTEAMQLFVHQRQKVLKEYLTEAHEWGQARHKAARDRWSNWQLLCQQAENVCCHGDSCTYAAAASAFFAANAGAFSRAELAVALRNILMNGPSKTTRVPMIIGPTNSGKSTLVLPFDKLFGFDQVFHKPALGSSFALRNIVKDKRFLLWDDFRPVEYGQKTIPVTTFLSLFQGQPFEVQVSQSFNDGNLDFEWHHGCVLTAKADALWTPMPGVDEEDIRHMKSRLTLFQCGSTVKHLRHTTPCATCMSKWIFQGALDFDGQQVLASSVMHNGEVLGMQELAEKAGVPSTKAAAMAAEITAMGAVNVTELTVPDWRSLASFAALGLFEQRRLLAAVCS